MSDCFKSIFLIAYLLAGCVCHAQPDQIKQIAQGISGYRSYLLEMKAAQRRHLGVVIKKLEALGLSDEKRSELTTFVGKVAQPDGYTNPAHVDFMISMLQDKPWLDSLTDQELQILAINADLYDLVNLGVLELEYPYKVKPGFNLLQELLFYHIEDGERIAEIGAGNGEFSIVLATIYDRIRLYINEIDLYQISYIRDKVQRTAELTREDTLVVVQGDHWQTNIPPRSVDKVILRNAFHHFSDKKPMLTSISAAMGDRSVLFLYEASRDLNRKELCDSAMWEKDIVKSVTKAGFQLLESKVVDQVVLLKFEKTSKR